MAGVVHIGYNLLIVRINNVKLFRLGWVDYVHNQELLDVVFMRTIRIIDRSQTHFIITEVEPSYEEVLQELLYPKTEDDFGRAFPTDTPDLEQLYLFDALTLNPVISISWSMVQGAAGGRAADVRACGPRVEEGGFIPFCHHRVSPDLHYNSYLFYLEKIQEILGRWINLKPIKFEAD